MQKRGVPCTKKKRQTKAPAAVATGALRKGKIFPFYQSFILKILFRIPARNFGLFTTTTFIAMTSGFLSI